MCDDCSTEIQDKDEGLSYARARTRTSGEEFPIEGIRPFKPWDIVEQAVQQQQSIACFYRGSLEVGLKHPRRANFALQLFIQPVVSLAPAANIPSCLLLLAFVMSAETESVLYGAWLQWIYFALLQGDRKMHRLLGSQLGPNHCKVHRWWC